MKLRSIREEPAVTQSLQRAANIYPRVYDAYDSMCWILTRREMGGVTIPTVKDVYHMHKQAAGGYGVPSLLVIYTVEKERILFHAIKIG